MSNAPHILGIDDGPFFKDQSKPVPIAAVMMEAGHLVEGVALSSFPVDGGGITEHLINWIGSMKWLPSLQAIMIEGITIAGLAVVDIRRLHSELELPVLSVTRKPTVDQELVEALHSADFGERIATVKQSPATHKVRDGIYMSFSGVTLENAKKLLESSLLKSNIPEPVRLAHLIGAAVEEGESKGNV